MKQKRTIIELIDDLDGTTPEATTITFGIDGKMYEIELGERNEVRLRKALAPFLEKARPVRQKRTPKKRTTGKRQRPEPAKVREWAAKNGVEVADKGRIPQEVMDQYAAAS
jgi:hypothetical protein